MSSNQRSKNSDGRGSGKEEESQARTGTAVREGQEDSSILHDKEDPNKELTGTLDKDVSSTSQEEFIEDRNTKKDDDA
ncbi:MAG TPA: hypothetical protein VEZ17_02410 [Chitinophagaceae bacterium]|jgi:hypothetical protein|nr:hypothetical protein [Chitinophagaceae bacterium]